MSAIVGRVQPLYSPVLVLGSRDKTRGVTGHMKARLSVSFQYQNQRRDITSAGALLPFYVTWN